MEEVFYDLAVLNAAKSIDASFYEKQGADISSLIYKKYGVDSLLLAQNISYYAAQPEKCKQILSHVETKSNKRLYCHLRVCSLWTLYNGILWNGHGLQLLIRIGFP